MKGEVVVFLTNLLDFVSLLQARSECLGDSIDAGFFVVDTSN